LGVSVIIAASEAWRRWVKINSTRRYIGLGPVDELPAPVVFSPNPVGDLIMVYAGAIVPPRPLPGEPA
jgi:hypothetical protein